MCFLDKFEAQSQNLVLTHSIYRRRHENKCTPSDQISDLDLIPMLSFCELRSRDHHNTTFTNFFTLSTLLDMEFYYQNRLPHVKTILKYAHLNFELEFYVQETQFLKEIFLNVFTLIFL